MKDFLLTAYVYFLLMINFAWIGVKCLFLWRNPRKEFDQFIDEVLKD